MNIFLVDDEMGIVEGMKTVIRRHIPECEVIGIAHNGLEGARLIQDAQPDIVITDIRMPQADGLEMIERLKAAGCRAKFIVLSGFAEFDYARKGIHLGVQFYINKPVEEEELRDCVRQVMAEINSERAKLREVDQLKEQVHSKLTESVLRDMIDAGGEDPAYLLPMLGTIGFPLAGTRYCCALLEFETGTDALQEGRIEVLYREIESCLHLYMNVYRFRYVGSQIVVIVTGDLSLEEREFARSVGKMKENFLSRLSLPMSAGISSVHDTVSGISKSFEEARQALSESILKFIEFKSTHKMSRKKDVITEVKEYVVEHYQENISLADLSGRFFINPYYLSQLFKQKTGGTYLNFLAKTRIDKACELLEKTELRVYEICQMVGYTDTHHFTRLFEKLVGCKPTEYRKTRLNNG